MRLADGRPLPYAGGMNTDLFILDSYALIYRSYFAFISRPLSNGHGENVSAVFGFFRSLKTLFDRCRPAYFAAAFDSAVPTFRHRLYPAYKATRQKTPEDLHAQIPAIEAVLSALGVPALRADGYEADDVVATLVRRANGAGRRCHIVSGDKDLLQLVSPTVDVFRGDKAGGWEVSGADGVRAEWGVPPDRMLDLLSLVGDSADNVPGVAGVGPKTALRLLGDYSSLDGIYARADEIKGAVGAKIRAGKESAYFSRSLIALKDDAPIAALDSGEDSNDPFAPLSAARLNYRAAADLLLQYGVPSLAKLYAGEDGLFSAENAAVPGTSASSDSGAATRSGADGGENADTASRDAQNAAASGAGGDFTVYAKNAGDYRAVTSLAELSAFIDAVLAKAAPECAFDCETDSLNAHEARLVGFSLSRAKSEAIYVPLLAGDALTDGTLVAKNDAFGALSRIFGDPACLIAMHNGKFDCEALRANGFPAPRARVFDTMIAAWLLEPDRASFSLGALAKAKLGLETISFGEVVPKGATFADVPLDKAAPYAAEDADLTWQLYKLFAPRLAAEKLERLFWDVEMPLLPILAEMEIRGIHLEKAELAVYSAELAQKIADAEQGVYETVGHEFNIASTKQLQEVLFAERGLPTGKKTKTGFSTDTAVLEELSALDPVPRKILDYRTLAKLKSTYVDALPALADRNSRVHTSFIQTGTATGRLSSRDPNLQNIPVRGDEGRRIRAAFTAAPGCLLISADYAQIELVVLAHLSGDEALCRAFAAGSDVHKATAALIFGVAAEAVSADQRRAAKTINFGVMYGMSAFRLARELAIPRAKAQDFLDSYNATYAGVQRYFSETIMQAEQRGYVETLFGRRRALPAILSRNKTEKSAAERVAKNTPIQGSAADIVKKAMIALDAALWDAGSPARVLLQVHDELILECPEREAAAAAALVKSVLEGVVALKAPLKASVETGPHWGDFH